MVNMIVNINFHSNFSLKLLNRKLILSLRQCYKMKFFPKNLESNNS